MLEEGGCKGEEEPETCEVRSRSWRKEVVIAVAVINEEEMRKKVAGEDAREDGGSLGYDGQDVVRGFEIGGIRAYVVEVGLEVEDEDWDEVLGEEGEEEGSWEDSGS